MSTYFEDIIRLKSEHLADLKKTAAEVERELSDARDSLQREAQQREFAQSRAGQAAEPAYAGEPCQCEQCQPARSRVPSPRTPAYTAPRLDYDFVPDQADAAETDRFEAGRYAAGLAGELGDPDTGPC